MSLNRILRLLDEVDVDDQVELLIAVMQSASEDAVVEALMATHPDLLLDPEETPPA